MLDDHMTFQFLLLPRVVQERLLTQDSVVAVEKRLEYLHAASCAFFEAKHFSWELFLCGSFRQLSCRRHKVVFSETGI